MCQNYTYDVQTQVVSAFGGVSATDREVGSNHCRDEKRTESHNNFVNHAPMDGVVATIAAMKSGLKAAMSFVHMQIGGVATIAAMKSGLKGHEVQQQADAGVL